MNELIMGALIVGAAAGAIGPGGAPRAPMVLIRRIAPPSE
jgi:hypothetical protein